MPKTKKELVRMLVNQDLEMEDHDYLINLLVEDPIARDVDKQLEDNSKLGARLADKLTEIAGSWIFIIGFFIFLIVWMSLNIYWGPQGFDKYPFILLNLILSCLAAIQAPVIMMSQNRQSEKDRLRSENDYKVDTKSELILEDLHHKMEAILKNQKEIQKQLNELENK